MKLKKYQKIGIGLILLIGIIAVFYFGFSQTFLSYDECAYVWAKYPDKSYGCAWGGTISKDKILYLKYPIPEYIFNGVRNNELRILEVQIDDEIPCRCNYGDHRIGIYATTSDWNIAIKYNNAPAKEKVGTVSRAKYNDRGSTSNPTPPQIISSDLLTNLLNHINDNIQKGNSKFGIVFIQETPTTNNCGATPFKVKYTTEESTDFYRLSNNCNQIKLFPEQVTSEDYETEIACKEKIVTPPIDPDTSELKGFSLWFSLIKDWFKSIFNIPITQTMFGATEVEPNTLQTYNMDLKTSNIDNDYSDGTYSIQYANWALIDKNGDIKQQGTWEKVDGEYIKDITITTPSAIGDYALLAMITQFDMNYNFQTKQWETSEEKIMIKEAINIKNKYTITTPTNPIARGFSKFSESIFNWFKNLFNWK